MNVLTDPHDTYIREFTNSSPVEVKLLHMYTDWRSFAAVTVLLPADRASSYKLSATPHISLYKPDNITWTDAGHSCKWLWEPRWRLELQSQLWHVETIFLWCSYVRCMCASPHMTNWHFLNFQRRSWVGRDSRKTMVKGSFWCWTFNIHFCHVSINQSLKSFIACNNVVLALNNLNWWRLV